MLNDDSPELPAARLRTPLVALDTEVFKGEGYNFATNHLKRVRDAGAAGTVALLVTDITDREVRAQITRAVHEAAGKVNNTFRKSVAILLQQPAYAALGTAVDADAATAAALAAYDAYCAEAGIKVLSTAALPAGPVLDAYFAGRPPFGAGDKKSEFPDAFTVAALAARCDVDGSECYVVSGDAGVRDACAAHPRLIPLERTAQLVDLLTAHAAFEAGLVARARASFEHLRAEIVARVHEEFSELLFDIGSDEYADPEVDQVAPQRVRIDTADLTDLDDEAAEFECTVTVRYTAEVRADDPDATYYDREDAKTYVFNRIAGEVTDTATVTAFVQILLDPDGREEPQLDSVRIEEQSITVSLNDFVRHPDADESWDDEAK